MGEVGVATGCCLTVVVSCCILASDCDRVVVGLVTLEIPFTTHGRPVATFVTRKWPGSCVRPACAAGAVSILLTGDHQFRIIVFVVDIRIAELEWIATHLENLLGRISVKFVGRRPRCQLLKLLAKALVHLAKTTNRLRSRLEVALQGFNALVARLEGLLEVVAFVLECKNFVVKSAFAVVTRWQLRLE